MAVFSRTPEGTPHRCPVCGKESFVESSIPTGDSCCPSCGQLLWWFRDRLAHLSNNPIEQITLNSSFTSDMATDSLDIVELVMEIEEKFNITIPDEEAERLKTVADVIRFIRQRMKER
jgi:acyl carrier protein